MFHRCRRQDAVYDHAQRLVGNTEVGVAGRRHQRRARVAWVNGYGGASDNALRTAGDRGPRTVRIQLHNGVQEVGRKIKAAIRCHVEVIGHQVNAALAAAR